jgi:dolichol-phosphate mannosyltransferase
MYNEESGAEACVRAVLHVLEAMPGQHALVAVEDGSRDATARILRSLVPLSPHFVLLEHPANRGYGAALRTGTECAAAQGYDYVLFMDSDLTNDPRDIPRFIEKMREGYDVIKASRFRPGGGMEGVPWQRAFFSLVGNLVARALFRAGIRDCTNGFRAVRTSVLMGMDLRERGFAVIVEELYYSKFLARSFCEVPVRLTSRASNQRPTSFSYSRETLSKYFSYAWKAFRGHVPPGIREYTGTSGLL